MPMIGSNPHYLNVLLDLRLKANTSLACCNDGMDSSCRSSSCSDTPSDETILDAKDACHFLRYHGIPDARTWGKEENISCKAEPKLLAVSKYWDDDVNC